MNEGTIFTYNGISYKYSGGRLWQPLSMRESDRMLKIIIALKNDPKTKVYGKRKS